MVDSKLLARVRELEHAPDARIGSDELEASSPRLAPRGADEQRTEPGGVEEVAAGEVDDDACVGSRPLQRSLEIGRRGKVELASDVHERQTVGPVLDVHGELSSVGHEPESR